MLEDPRTQRMKQMKIELLKNFVICILIALVIYFVSVGMPLFGMPKLDDVVSAQATYDGQTVEIAQEDMQIAVDLAGGLHIWPGTVETGLTRAYITYQMADGSQMVGKLEFPVSTEDDVTHVVAFFELQDGNPITSGEGEDAKPVPFFGIYTSFVAQQAVFLGEDVVKYHRTLTTYLDTLLTGGFALRRVVEAKPPERMLDIPGMKDELRRPMMLLVAAVKL